MIRACSPESERSGRSMVRFWPKADSGTLSLWSELSGAPQPWPGAVVLLTTLR